MKSDEANRLIESIVQESKNGASPRDLVPKLIELREKALEEQDPALVKILRLCYEHIEEQGDFEIGFSEMEDMGDFEYLLYLILKSDNPVNREEIREISDTLMEMRQ